MVFAAVVVLLLVAISRPRGHFDIITPFWIVILIAFVLIWGGFFWW
jgi:hypothetical protein